MKLLEERIRREGTVIGDDVLKVDMFLNHQLDVGLIDEMGKAFYEAFQTDGVTKILTVEASGIALAALTARYFGVPVVFAKKAGHRNVGTDLYTATCHSFTHGTDSTICVSRRYLHEDDVILIIDDFLADGNACNALRKLISDAGAKLAGIGIGIEKGFQPGGAKLRAEGIKVRSLAIVESMKNGNIVFRSDDAER